MALRHVIVVVVCSTSPLIFVNFDMPFFTDHEFFGPQIVSNMASFFDIPEDKITVRQ